MHLKIRAPLKTHYGDKGVTSDNAIPSDSASIECLFELTSFLCVTHSQTLGLVYKSFANNPVCARFSLLFRGNYFIQKNAVKDLFANINTVDGVQCQHYAACV